MKNKGKSRIDLIVEKNPFTLFSDSEQWFDFERLEFIEKVIQRHLDKPRGDSKKSLKRLKAERTRLRNKYTMG